MGRDRAEEQYALSNNKEAEGSRGRERAAAREATREAGGAHRVRKSPAQTPVHPQLPPAGSQVPVSGAEGLSWGDTGMGVGTAAPSVAAARPAQRHVCFERNTRPASRPSDGGG